MKENKYDNSDFFSQYSQMSRSVEGLKGAGEWHVLQKMLPDFAGKRVLDLGCGFGWHCVYAIEHGATHVTGIDISEKMLEEAQKRNPSPLIEYQCMAIEDFDFQPDTYDIVISSLTFHYLESFTDICRKINNCLTPGGRLRLLRRTSGIYSLWQSGMALRPRREAYPLAGRSLFYGRQAHSNLSGRRGCQIPQNADYVYKRTPSNRI